MAAFCKGLSGMGLEPVEPRGVDRGLVAGMNAVEAVYTAMDQACACAQVGDPASVRMFFDLAHPYPADFLEDRLVNSNILKYVEDGLQTTFTEDDQGWEQCHALLWTIARQVVDTFVHCGNCDRVCPRADPLDYLCVICRQRSS